MTPGYEFFDHTADLGVRVRAYSLPDLVRIAGEGMYGVIGDLVPEGQPRPEAFTLTGGDMAELLRDYLAELLLIFERDHRIVTVMCVEAFEPGRLAVMGESWPVSIKKSAFDREIKAVTYHGLAIKPIEGGFEATYIVDI